MIVRKTLVAALLVGMHFSSSAQISHGGVPHGWEHKSNNVEYVQMPNVDVEALKSEDAITEQYKDIPLRFAYAHEVDFNLSNAGEWTTLPNGDRLWQLGIESPGAYSLNFTFDQFVLEEGTSVFIYNKDLSYKIGSFTHENNKASGQLGTAPVIGDRVVVEFYEPAEAKGTSKLSLSHVAHDYKDAFKMAKTFGSSGDCNNNVACPISAGWQDQISSVAMITLGNGTRWCSGAMIANTSGDDTPYFLTADHCEDGQNVTNWVFYFNYQSPTCTPNADGSLSQSVSGSTLRAENPNSDVCLLELSSVPPAAYGVFYCGWDKSDSPVPNAVGIHHPAGDVKKFSIENNALTTNGTNWVVNDWDDGTTEGGSSGSPLFDQNKRIIGQLLGGQAACGNDLFDLYGRLAVSWNGANAASRLKDWLDPSNTNNNTQDGYFPGSSSIVENTESIDFSVYPNPSSGLVNVDLGETASESVIKVISSTGQTIAVVSTTSGVTELDLSGNAEGLYFVEVSNGETVTTKKVTLLH